MHLHVRILRSDEQFLRMLLDDHARIVDHSDIMGVGDEDVAPFGVPTHLLLKDLEAEVLRRFLAGGVRLHKRHGAVACGVALDEVLRQVVVHYHRLRPAARKGQDRQVVAREVLKSKFLQQLALAVTARGEQTREEHSVASFVVIVQKQFQVQLAASARRCQAIAVARSSNLCASTLRRAHLQHRAPLHFRRGSACGPGVLPAAQRCTYERPRQSTCERRRSARHRRRLPRCGS
mmetsp:Transcript_73221/g.212036  ORF Transcript_73221/g.212036 Transcript_73221/m.212036 type:complete len:234 (-) Transcript_73221:20-721(-)